MANETFIFAGCESTEKIVGSIFEIPKNEMVCTSAIGIRDHITTRRDKHRVQTMCQEMVELYGDGVNIIVHSLVLRFRAEESGVKTILSQPNSWDTSSSEFLKSWYKFRDTAKPQQTFLISIEETFSIRRDNGDFTGRFDEYQLCPTRSAYAYHELNMLVGGTNLTNETLKESFMELTEKYKPDRNIRDAFYRGMK